jgi:hypothetical protein
MSVLLEVLCTLSWNISCGNRYVRGPISANQPLHLPLRPQVYEPECYRVLYERLIVEQGIAEERRILHEKALSEIAAERHHVKLHQALDKRKQKRLAREAARDTSAKVSLVMEQRHKHLAEEMEANLKTKEKVLQQNGLWVKDDVDHWSFSVRDSKEKVNSSSLYADNLRMMSHLRELNGMERYDQRWKKATAHPGGLELNWTKADAFTLLPPLPGTPFITGYPPASAGDAKRGGSRGKGAHAVGREEHSLVPLSRGGASRGGGMHSGDGSRAMGADHLQLEHGAHRHHKDSGGGAAKAGGGILKHSAYKESDTSALEKHAFGGMFVGQQQGAIPAPQPVPSSALVVKKRAKGAAAGAAHGEDGSGGPDPYLEETRGLPVVDAQYADSDDEQLYDEDLEEMLRELTTF